MKHPLLHVIGFLFESYCSSDEKVPCGKHTLLDMFFNILFPSSCPFHPNKYHIPPSYILTLYNHIHNLILFEFPFNYYLFFEKNIYYFLSLLLLVIIFSVFICILSNGFLIIFFFPIIIQSTNLKSKSLL